MSPPPTTDVAALLAEVEGVRRLARVLVRGDEADDLAQEAVVVALERPPKEGYGMRSWLAGIVRRLARGRRRADERRRAREAAVARSESGGGVDGGADRLDALDALDVKEHLARRRLVIEAVAALPEESARAVCLRYFEDLPPRRIAERLGVPVETARTRVRRAVERLREELDRRHAGSRTAWSALLLPLARPPLSSPAGAPATSIPEGHSIAEGLAVSSTSKAAVLVGALLLLASGGFLVAYSLRTDDGPASSPETKPGVAARAPAPADRSLAARPGLATPAVAADGEAGAASAPTNPAAADRSHGGDPTGASFSGRVAGPDGKPVVGATVSLRPDSALAHYLRLDLASRWSLLETTSDEQGRFRFDGIKPGDGYGIFVTASGRALSRMTGLSFRSRDATTAPDIALTEGVAASGRVVTQDAKPVAGARVAVSPKVDNPLEFVLARADAQAFLEAKTETDAEGRWRLAALEPGNKSVFVEKVEKDLLAAAVVPDVLVGKAAETSVPDVVLHPAGTIEGTATLGDGGPAVGARVLVAFENNKVGYSADVAADGRWRIEGVPPGRGPIYGFLRGLAPVFGAPVETGARGIDLRFARPGRITGRVLGEGDKPVARFSVVALPIQDAEVDFMRQLVEQTLASVLGPVAVDSPTGDFTIDPLEPQRYRVQVVAPGLAPATTDPVVVPPSGSPLALVIRLARDSGLSGTVVDGGGAPVAGASLLAVVGGRTWGKPAESPTTGLVIRIGEPDPEPVEVKSGPDGHFSFPPLPPGAVGLTVRAAGFATWFAADVDPHASPEPLRVTLVRGGTLVGRVSFASHPTRKGAVLRLQSPLGSIDVAAAEGGEFRAENVAAGRWLLFPLVGELVYSMLRDESLAEVERSLGAATVDVVDGAETRREVVVPALASIAGQVEGVSEGGPRSVNAVVAQRFRVVDGEERFAGPFIAKGTASGDGHFVLEDVLPGHYRVLAFVSERTPTTVGGERQVQATGMVDVPAEPRTVQVTLTTDG